MRLCSGCQTKLPDDHKGLCAACKQARYGTRVNDGIKANDAGKAHTQAGYDAEMDKLRKTKEWQDARVRVIKRDGTCVRCREQGHPPAPIDIVDHKIPAQIAIVQVQESKRFPYKKYAGYYLTCNLQGLCRSCHAVKTLEDLAHAGPWPSVLDEYDKQPKKVWSF